MRLKGDRANRMRKSGKIGKERRGTEGVVGIKKRGTGGETLVDDKSGETKARRKEMKGEDGIGRQKRWQERRGKVKRGEVSSGKKR